MKIREKQAQGVSVTINFKIWCHAEACFVFFFVWGDALPFNEPTFSTLPFDNIKDHLETSPRTVACHRR